MVGGGRQARLATMRTLTVRLWPDVSGLRPSTVTKTGFFFSITCPVAMMAPTRCDRSWTGGGETAVAAPPLCDRGRVHGEEGFPGRVVGKVQYHCTCVEAMMSWHTSIQC